MNSNRIYTEEVKWIDVLSEFVYQRKDIFIRPYDFYLLWIIIFPEPATFCVITQTSMAWIEEKDVCVSTFISVL